MDSEFETDGYRYTIGQFMKLNQGKCKLPADLKEIFSKYSMPDCSMEVPHNNKLNIRFNPPGKEPPRKKMGLRKCDEIYSDIQILPSLRHAFSSVVKGSDGTVLAIHTMNSILIPITMTKEVAQLFFDTIIQSPKQMPEYLKLLFTFKQPNALERKIHLAFVQIAMEAFNSEIVLPDTILETGNDRSKKHRETTCKIIASLFVYKFDPKNPTHAKPLKLFSNVEKLKKSVIEPMLSEASKDSGKIKNLINVWKILNDGGYSDVLSLYMSDLCAIYKNPKYKLSTRILLRDYCE